ncbi:MAG: hypothetical protein ACLP01_07270 [Solirubrobacteraceae bacterium]
MSTIFGVLLVVVYIMLFITLALTTLRKRHILPFWIGIIFPIVRR